MGKYEEALERAKEIYNAPVATIVTRTFLEQIFPELKESEDERIRKSLIEVFKKKLEKGFEWVEYGIPNRSVLAWLEKQKEQQPAEYLDLDNASQDYVYNHFCQGADFTPDYIKGLMEDAFIDGANWQKEQKPADDEAKAIAYREYERGRENGLRDGQKYVLGNAESYGLCKPAEWSEEDKNMLESILGEYKSMVIEKRNWLNSLPERFSLQTKQEWNEEDEEMLNSIIATCQLAAKDRDSGPARHLLEMQERFLKSLRPQPKQNSKGLAISFMNYLDENRPEDKMCLSNGERADIEQAFQDMDWGRIIRYTEKYQPHWKPSEEQMGSLNYAYCELFKREDVGHNILGPLQNLIDILSKL